MIFQLRKRPYIFYLLISAVVLVSSISTAFNGGDFDVFLEASRKLVAGENIYAPPFVRGLQYYYSVLFATLLIPFSHQVFWSEVGWALLSYGLLYRSARLFKNWLIPAQCPEKTQQTWALLSVLFALQSILYNIWLLQLTIFLLWCVLEAMNLVQKGKEGLAAGLLALAINIKMMPLLILPYLFYRGYFKCLIQTLVFFIALLYLPALFIGPDTNTFLMHEWWKIINPANKEHLFETGIGTHSLVAFLPVYLTETLGEMPYPRHLINLRPEVVEWVIQLTRMALLALSLLYLKWPPFKRTSDSLQLVWEISFFCLLIPLLMPHQQKYAFLFGLPLLSYLLYFFTVAYYSGVLPRYWVGVLVFAICLFFYSPLYGSDVIGTFLFRLTQHFRCLTWASLFLIPLSLCYSPSVLKSLVNQSNDKMAFSSK